MGVHFHTLLAVADTLLAVADTPLVVADILLAVGDTPLVGVRFHILLGEDWGKEVLRIPVLEEDPWERLPTEIGWWCLDVPQTNVRGGCWLRVHARWQQHETCQRLDEKERNWRMKKKQKKEEKKGRLV